MFKFQGFKFIINLYFILFLFSCQLYAQVAKNDENTPNETFEEALLSELNRKGFNLGIYVGVYIPNQYTAQLYNGYGFNAEGDRNSFYQSFMYNKIVLEYGGGYGQKDYVAEALGVNPGEWSFNENDMPINMRYIPAFMFAFNLRYSVDKKNSIIINIEGTKINARGNFTLNVQNAPSVFGQPPRSIQTFGIRGSEQRLLLQLGYQRLLGKNEKLQLILEGGMNITLAKFDKNDIMINNLYIDLTANNYYPGGNAYVIRKPVGVGYGAFVGTGFNVSIDPRWRIQLVYVPSLENIKILQEDKLKIQNGIGVRMYWNF
jgi:hypothetical protein